MSQEKADLQRWMQERVDEIRRSQSGAAPDRDDPARPLPKSEPVFGVPHPPPAIHHDDHPPEREVPIYRPFRASLPRDRQPSPALAAFRLGHLGVAMWVWAELLWDDLVRRSNQQPCHNGAMTGVPLVADRLLEARRDLADSIAPGIYDELARAVDRLSAFNRETIDQYVRATFGPGLYVGGNPPWESMCQELAFACGRALAKDHPLRPVFEMGVAFGEFDRVVSRYYADLHEGIEDEPLLPEIRDLAFRAASIPEVFLARSPLLGSLARIGRDYDRFGHPDALLEYCKANREIWDESSPRCHSFMRPSRMASAQLELVERDLDGVPPSDCERSGQRSAASALEDAGGRPEWNKKLLKLIFNGKEIRKVRSDADQVIKILDVFHEEGWGPCIDNPIGGPAASQASRLKEAVATLNEKLPAGTIRFRVLDKNSVVWEKC